MAESDRYVLVDPSEDQECPEETKQYLLERGYLPYRTRRGKIRWISKDSRNVRNCRNRRKSLFFVDDMFGNRRLKPWVKLYSYIVLGLLAIYILFFHMQLHIVIFR